MLKITSKLANQKDSLPQVFEVVQQQDDILLNGVAQSWDLVLLKSNLYHVIKDNQSFIVEVVKADYQTKQFTVKVNGQAFDLAARDRFDLLLKKLGMDKAANAKVSEVKAPMPGLLVSIKVTDGTEVKKGDTLVILEAMKMENALKSPIDGKVKTIKVKAGQNVDKNQVILQFE